MNSQQPAFEGSGSVSWRVSMGLEGVRILLVEDEALVAMSVEDMLADLGCEVTASAENLDVAIEKTRAVGFECALLI